MAYEHLPEGKRKMMERDLEERKFGMLLKEYVGLFDQVKNLRRSERAQFDDKVKAKIQTVDRKRHEKHLDLLESGMKLGRNADAVLADIIREQGSLAEYGLPEFSILDWRGNAELEGKYSDDECVILYDASSVGLEEEDGASHQVQAPDDYRVRQARAAALAERVHGKLENDYNSKYFHTVSQLFLGVIIPKDRLEEVAGIIRDEPEKYRFGDEFYSPEEKALVEKFKTEKKDGWIDEIPLLSEGK